MRRRLRDARVDPQATGLLPQLQVDQRVAQMLQSFTKVRSSLLSGRTLNLVVVCL